MRQDKRRINLLKERTLAFSLFFLFQKEEREKKECSLTIGKKNWHFSISSKTCICGSNLSRLKTPTMPPALFRVWEYNCAETLPVFVQDSSTASMFLSKRMFHLACLLMEKVQVTLKVNIKREFSVVCTVVHQPKVIHAFDHMGTIDAPCAEAQNAQP